MFTWFQRHSAKPAEPIRKYSKAVLDCNWSIRFVSTCFWMQMTNDCLCQMWSQLVLLCFWIKEVCAVKRKFLHFSHKQGSSANKRGVGTHPETSDFILVLKQNLEKMWERRSHAFTPHFTPAHKPRCVAILKCFTDKFAGVCKAAGNIFEMWLFLCPA